MRKRILDGRDEIAVGVSVADGQAIERCLKAEDVTVHGHERLRVIHFDRRLPRTLNQVREQEHALEVRVIERSTAPDKVTLEVKRQLSDELRHVELELPRRALRAALRPNALQDLAPDAPGDLVPVLGIEFTRRLFRSRAGWSVTLDRDLAFHRIDARMLERTGQLALGVPDRFADGRVLVTVTTGGAVLPTWLEGVVRASSPWNIVEEGFSLVAPRPSPRGPGPDLRLVLH
ncbi:MAG: hypothetical protein IRZ16_09990 [Myxococcaceae bacterium]|nr:hypothetical protein [Myxococcaceae bacterium]